MYAPPDLGLMCCNTVAYFSSYSAVSCKSERSRQVGPGTNEVIFLLLEGVDASAERKCHRGLFIREKKKKESRWADSRLNKMLRASQETGNVSWFQIVDWSVTSSPKCQDLLSEQTAEQSGFSSSAFTQHRQRFKSSIQKVSWSPSTASNR